jgi:hypothetical protein
VLRGTSAADDLTQLVSLISGDWRYPSSAWIDGVPDTLLRCWTGNEQLRDMCLEGAARQWEHGDGIKKSVATALLAAAFPGDDRVAAWVADELENNPHPFLMASQPQTWRNIAQSFRDHPVVIDATLKWIPGRQFHDSQVSLLALVSRTSQMRDLLISRLADASFPHWPADSLLEGWGMRDPAAAEALLGFLSQRSPAEASQIAHLLPRIIDNPGQARAALLEMLRAPDARRPDFVVAGLAQLTEPGDVTEIITAAEAHLTSGMSSTLPGLIAGFPQHPRVRELAVAALGEHDAPVYMVARAYGSDPEVRRKAANVLAPLPPPLRSRIIETLARRPLSDTATTALLERFDAERHGDVKLLAATAWAKRIRHNPEATTHAVERLTRLVHATGLDYEERRRAAFAALLVLGHVDAFTGLREQYGEQGPVRVAPDPLHRGSEFPRIIAEHWTMLSEWVGDQLSTRLSGPGDTASFWTAMCTVAAAFPNIQPSVLQAIDAHREVAGSIPALSFTATARAGTPALLDQLLNVIDAANGPGPARGDLERALFAADIIARQFGDSPDAAARLTGSRLSSWELGRTAALCRGWHDHPAIHGMYQQIDPDEPIWADRELRYAILPALKLVAEFRRDIDRMTEVGSDLSFLVGGPLSARLRRDPDALRAFEETLTGNADPVMKAAIPSALSSAGVLTQTVTDWCAAEIGRQAASQTPDLGFDLRTAKVRGVMITLTDVLQGTPM